MSKIIPFPRGSEWSRWDLHIHTPASFFWNDGKKLSEMDTAEKEVAIKKFILVVNNSNVDVFAVQDYWTFDWILELRKYLIAHPDELKKKVLSGMELRVESSTDYRLNIHVILSDSLTNQQLSDFKSELKIRIGTTQKNVSNEALIEFAKSLDISKAKHHGYGDPSKLNDSQLLELGSKTAVVTRDSLTKAFTHIPKGSGFILLPYDTSDGLLELDWRNHPQDDNYFMQTANIFESRDQRNIDLFNGIETKENTLFFKNFFKTLGNKTKPCIAGSDAHKFSDYGKYPSNKTTWIKANPTFEGLTQIVYECAGRVRIEELQPEAKASHTLIDRIEYKTSGTSTKTVYFNQNLNSIIGSRAQGKSNLLKNIVYAIDPEQCKLRGITSKDFYPLKNFKVIWSDGKENTLDLSESKEKGILFIPQKYLGELVYENDPRFDNFIIDLFENREDFKKASEIYKSFESLNVIEITSTIRNILTTLKSGREKSELLKKLGKIEDQDKEIVVIEDKIKKFGKTASITPAELKEYELLNNSKTAKNKEINSITQDINSYEELRQEEIINADKLLNLTFSKYSLTKIKGVLLDSDKTFKEDFIDTEVKELKKINIVKNKEIVAVDKLIKPLQDKLNESKTLLELTALLEKRKIIKKQVEELNKELVVLRESYNQSKKEIITIYQRYEKEYSDVDINLGNLDFSQVKLVISFDMSQFIKVIDDNINYHNSTDFRKDTEKKYTTANKFLNNPIQWSYSKVTFAVLIKELMEGLLSEKLHLKTGKDLETVLLELLKNRYKINFIESITNKKGVKFSEMSDGEQMITLLEFIFKFDDYNYPVLLDQPEDDLDSKAISKTIVDFIKLEKSKRQIIIVSHNANLVVCSDSEEVLISEKNGRSNPEFEYTSGAIEDTYINKEIVELLEGGAIALKKRMQKLNISEK